MRHPSFAAAFALLLALSPAFAGDKQHAGLPDPTKEMGQNGNQAGGGPGPGPGKIGGNVQISANVMSVVKSMGLTDQVAAIVNGDVGAGLRPEVFAKLSKGVFDDAAQKRTGDVQFLITSGGSHFSQRVLTPGPWGERQYQKEDLIRLGTTVTGTADQSEKVVAVLRNTGQPKLTEAQQYAALQKLGKEAFGPRWSADSLDGDPNNDWGGRRDGDANRHQGPQPGQFGQRRDGDRDKDGNGAPDLVQRFAKFSMAQGLEELIARDNIPLPRGDDGGGGNPNPNPDNGGGSVHPRPPVTPCSIWGGCPIPVTPDESKVDAKDKIIGGNTSGALSSLDKGLANGGGADLLAMRGGIKLEQGQYADAARDAKRALEMDPGNRDAQAVLRFSEGRSGASGGGERGFAGGQGGAGAATFGSAARLASPSGAPAFTAPGSRSSSDQSRKAVENALKLGDTAGALALASRSLSQDPNDPFMLNLRASIYARMKDYKKAAADAAAGLALAPKNAALLRTKGYADLRSGNYKDAMGSANQLLELDGKDSFAFALRGHAYGNLGDREAMLADLRRAAELDPRYQQAASGQLQMPSDSDILFLFPGEEGAKPAAAAAPEGRNKKFGLMVGVSVFGGLLLALGLLQTVLAPLKEQVSSVFTRMTRTGPSVASFAEPATAQPASAGGLLPGLIRGQYEISRQIGQGGMGTVFEGTDKSLGRRVAIKKMREELRVNPQERARFVIEAKTVAALHHPNVVDIYAIAEDGQDVFLVFEYVDGKTVHDLVQTSGRLAPKDAARIVRAGADALGYAHSRGVIHRDMKPSNMMIDSAGRVKVMDFGIARMAKDAMTRYSMTNTVVGTPPYMAPEQEQGQVRRESDVYALAVCAYEMLTGKLPFVGIGAGMLMNKINMSYVPPSRAIAGLPEALDAVFAKAFQAVPESRYRTPQEFADALESSLGSGVRA